jgi:hypothetical protein
MKKLLLILLLVPALMVAMEGGSDDQEHAHIKTFQAYQQADRTLQAENNKYGYFTVAWICASKPLISTLSRTNADYCALCVTSIGALVGFSRMFLTEKSEKEFSEQRTAVKAIIENLKTDYTVKDNKGKTLSQYFSEIEKINDMGLKAVIDQRKLDGILRPFN